MNIKSARLWLVFVSLSFTAFYFIFFLLAPVLGFPLTFPQSLRLLEILAPVFFGYIGSAVRFLFIPSPSVPIRAASAELLPLLVKGPVIVFAVAVAAALAAFGISNRESAAIGSGMDLDTLALFISIALAFLAATTSILVPYLFPGGSADEHS